MPGLHHGWDTTGDFDVFDTTSKFTFRLFERLSTLLERVETDFEVSLEELAGEPDFSKSTVHYRLNKLKDSGVIEGVTAELNPLAFDPEMEAITDVSVTHEQGYSETIGEQLATIDGVEQVYYTMGDTDFVVISRV